MILPDTYLKCQGCHTLNEIWGVVVVIVWLLDLQLPEQSVPIKAKVVSTNPVHGKVCSIQQYVIKFFSDLREVGDFLWVLRFPPPIKVTTTAKLKYC